MALYGVSSLVINFTPHQSSRPRSVAGDRFRGCTVRASFRQGRAVVLQLQQNFFVVDLATVAMFFPRIQDSERPHSDDSVCNELNLFY
jgi:hypothetical protein